MKCRQGVTLVELMVTIAVAAILLAIGVPSLTSLYDSTRADNSIDRIENTFHFARNQAISLGRRVTVCPVQGDKCDVNWLLGVMVFTDENGNLERDPDEAILVRLSAFDGGDHINSSQDSYIFLANGLLLGGNAGSLTYCPKEKSHEASQQIVINANGRIRRNTEAVNCN